MLPRTKLPIPPDEELTQGIAAAFAEIRTVHPTGEVPAIYRTLSYNESLFFAIKAAAEAVHFKDGPLSRAQHELIASYVSALNKCRY